MFVIPVKIISITNNNATKHTISGEKLYIRVMRDIKDDIAHKNYQFQFPAHQL